MVNLGNVELFVRVSEAGSISAAARGLGITPAAASAAIKRLESLYDSQLFQRSTRSLRLTQAGEDFLEYCGKALQLLDEGKAVLQQGRESLSGEIHLGAPSDLGRDRLDGWLEPFRQRHPRIRLVMHLSDGLHDLFRNPIDLVLRYGALRDSNLVAKRLCDNRRAVCASPEYLAKHGHPAHFEDLLQHNCICFYRNGEISNRWRIRIDGEDKELLVNGDRAADDGAMVRQWALLGRGIAYKSRLDMQEDLVAGRLVDLFPEAEGEPAPLYAVYPTRHYQPYRVQALLTYLEEIFGRLPG